MENTKYERVFFEKITRLSKKITRSFLANFKTNGLSVENTQILRDLKMRILPRISWVVAYLLGDFAIKVLFKLLIIRHKRECLPRINIFYQDNPFCKCNAGDRCLPRGSLRAGACCRWKSGRKLFG